MLFEEIRSFQALKWNPFSPDVPVESLLQLPSLRSFIYRIENLVLDGGFALLTGSSGGGKSVILRQLAHHLSRLPEVRVGTILRSQSGISDFYREIGEIFGVQMQPNNRWGGYSALRKKWHHHISSTLLRPIVLIDEAQEMPDSVLLELRTLVADNFDSNNILTIILSGDQRLIDRLQSPALHPLATRIKMRHHQLPWTGEQIDGLLRHATEQAGRPDLLTPGLSKLLGDHASGSPRRAMHMAMEILLYATERKIRTLDERLYFEVFDTAQSPQAKSKKRT